VPGRRCVATHSLFSCNLHLAEQFAGLKACRQRTSGGRRQ
jgi:hypothetical protein